MKRRATVRFRMFCLNHGLCACFLCLFCSVLFCFVFLFVFALVLLVCLFLPLLSSFHCVLLFLLFFCSFIVYLVLLCSVSVAFIFMFFKYCFVCCFGALCFCMFLDFPCFAARCLLILPGINSLPFLWRARMVSITGFVFIHYHIQFNDKRDKRP